MIHVTVYLNIDELASLTIVNDGTGTPEAGNYEFTITDEDKMIKGNVKDFPRKEEDVWSLILRVLKKVKENTP